MIYPYKCKSCEITQDLNFRLADRPETVVCANCGGTSERQFLVAKIHLPRHEDWNYYPIDPLTKEPRTAGNRHGQSYAQAKKQEKDNEEYLRNKPKPQPEKTYDDYYKEALKEVS